MAAWFLSSLKALLQYKQQDTPVGFTIDETLLAFWIGNDPNSDSLRLVPHTDVKGRPISPQEITFFDDTMNPATAAGVKDIKGWYQGACPRAQRDWNALESTVRERAQRKLNKGRRFLDMSGGVSGFTAAEGIWTVRGFFIGPDHKHAPPYVTVLCSNTEISKRLVGAMQSILDPKIYPGWSVTRLPRVEVLMYGSSSGGNESADEEHADREKADAEAERKLEKIEVSLTDDRSFLTMANDNLSSWAHQEHRAGIRLEVRRDADSVAKGTVGGLVKVGHKLYGLTVSHVLLPIDVTIEDQQKTPDDQNRLPVSTTSGSGNTDNQETLTVLNRWHENGSINRDFDWALIEIPGLQELDSNPELWNHVNLVQTIAGDFRPVAVAVDKPYHLIQIVLATPHSSHGLRGVFIGSEALMGIPDSEIIHTPWVLRMERPWLIRSGGSGSWAFNAHTGEFLGILVGGCPELLEAYILPAHHTFDSIEQRFGGPVRLANCHPIDKKGSADLARSVDTYRKIKGRLDERTSLEDIEDIDNQVKGWIRKNCEAFPETARLPFILRTANSSWEKPSAYYYPPPHEFQEISRRSTAESLLLPKRKARFEFSLTTTLSGSYREALSWSSQECYNFISEKLVDGSYLRVKGMFFELLIQLMLRQSTGLGNSKSILAPYTHNRIFGNEVQLMSHKHAHLHAVCRLPWDRRTLTSIINDMENDIASKFGDHKLIYGWSSLPESKASELEAGCKAILTTLILRNHSLDTILVVVPPLGVGPRDSSDPVNNRSRPRLPLKLWSKSPKAADNMQIELLKDLNLDVTDCASIEELPLKEECSNIYLKEHARMVEMVVYYVVLQPGRTLEELHPAALPEGWSWGEERFFKSLASPFRRLPWMVDENK